ncbi:ferrous iron transporter B [Pseudobdellovibrio exovorus]|uniref:Ferrous iron transport protein B n=1 Tax=Pseudobdellovibrio exovorus JSS TaxID=1184267 RepID=M4VA34_9BACT|nr:ferrous iron transporter B [Pseudobdellovibrio exovorus]AGH95325.1 ferrous iron transport protein B [Pseudobdellovibrio exovorus JSS]
MSTWALVGSPNSGKTTLYNWLTGSKAKTVNYPGSTVEYSAGSVRPQLLERVAEAKELRIVDTPGIYSLVPQSEDEQVTHDVLFDKEHRVGAIDGVVVVLDATQLQRHLIIARQVLQSGYKAVFVLTMCDLIRKEGSEIDLARLKSELNSEIILFDGVLGQGLDEILQTLAAAGVPEVDAVACPQWSLDEQVEIIKWAAEVNSQTILKRDEKKSAQRLSHNLDQYLMHPIFGFVIFFSVMTVLFASIYWLAQPFMDLIDTAFATAVSAVTENIPGLVGEFLGEGLIAAIGGVVIFVPQIFILFVGIGILESTGYLARVAALIDKPLSMVGLGGRSFVPLLSGFACAIPAVMAARNITSKKERLIAQSIIPFMTCSARLPVYALMIGFLIGDSNPLMAGFVMAILYFGAIVVGALAANIIAVFIDDTAKSRLIMELPLYRRPHFLFILRQSLLKAKSFVFRAGPIILVLALVLWFATTFPRPEVAEGQDAPEATEIAQHSYAAQVGQAMEPIFRPMGVDWRVGFGLISAFAAREVFVSALALTFNISDENEDSQTQSLMTAMKEATFPDGTPIFTTASVVGILIFFMIALQCVTTVGVLKREMGSWKPALLQLFFSNLVAYCLAVTVVFVLHQFGL